MVGAVRLDLSSFSSAGIFAPPFREVQRVSLSTRKRKIKKQVQHGAHVNVSARRGETPLLIAQTERDDDDETMRESGTES